MDPDSPEAKFRSLHRRSVGVVYEKRFIRQSSIDLEKFPGVVDDALQISNRGSIELSEGQLDTLYKDERMDSMTIQRMEGKIATDSPKSNDSNTDIGASDRKEDAVMSKKAAVEKSQEEKLGTLMGVFVPCLQNILGVILFIRLSWIVGQAGMGEALGIVGMCCTCTFLTALSLSAIATNGHIKGGGPYYLIGRALGPELGVSVGICFYLGTSVAGAMYILGAVETILDIAPQLYLATESDAVAISRNDYRIYGMIILVLVVGVVFAGMKNLSRLAPAFLAPVLLSVFFILVGIWSSDSRDLDGEGISGISLANLKDNTASEYYRTDDSGIPENSDRFAASSTLVSWNFQAMLALFFPSVTGIMAGSNRSASLRNAQLSIPTGTLGAQLTTSVLYLSFVVFYASCASREKLLDERLLSAKISWPAPEVVSIGIILSTIGASLQSLAGAPRLLQAIANDRILPFLNILATEHDHSEPHKCLFVTFIVTAAAISAGKLDVITPIITMFFLLCYAGVNASCTLLDLMHAPNWRPRWRYYHWSLSLTGLVLCFIIMGLISLLFTAIALILVLVLYYSVASRPDKGSKDWGDGLRSLRFSFAVSTMLGLDRMGNRVQVNEWEVPGRIHPMNWYPNPLILCKPWGLLADDVPCHPKLIEFAKFLKPPRSGMTFQSQGFAMIVSILEGDYSRRFQTAMRAQRQLWEHVHKECNFRGFCEVIVANSVLEGFRNLIQLGGLGGLRPNMLVMRYPEQWQLNKVDSLSPRGKRSSISPRVNEKTIAEQFQTIVSDAHTAGKAIVIIKGLDNFPFSDRKFARRASSQASMGSRSDSEPSLPDSMRADRADPNEVVIDLEPRRSETNGGVDVAGGPMRQMLEKGAGTIDTYWIVHDGGLMLLIATIFRRHKVWTESNLRIFSLVDAKQDVLKLKKELSALLFELRVKAEVIVLDINIEYTKASQAERQDIAAKVNMAKDAATKMKRMQTAGSPSGSEKASPEKEATDSTEVVKNQLKGKDKSLAHSESLVGILQLSESGAATKHYEHFVKLSLKLNLVVRKHSKNASLVMLSLPPPPAPPHSAHHYMNYIDHLLENIPRVLLVRGYRQDVVTVFS